MNTYKITIERIFLLVSFFYFLNASAQAPNKMSYQAVVRNTAGTLVANANVGIQISILQTTATGAPVYLERHTTTSNANGLATLEIGGGAPVAGVFANINWANGPYFIKTETDPIGGTNYTISGTSQMLSVPYALFAAKSADNINSWNKLGNNAAATDFIGTNNNQDLVFKRNGIEAGRIGNINLSIGLGALPLNINGLRNTAFGTSALSSNTTGDDNVAIGFEALRNNTTAFSNIAVGRSALSANIDGSFNIAIGGSTLISNTNGESNVAIGSNSLESNTSGFKNTAIGKNSLQSNTTAVSNTAVGAEALKSNTASRNTAIGDTSLLNNISGTENTALGHATLILNTTGSDNVAIGTGALRANTTALSNTAVGKNALLNNNGESNTAVGRGALSNHTTGFNNTGIGAGAQVPSATAFHQVRIGNTAVTSASVQVAWTITSDNRWKSNIQKSNLGLEFIKQLNPVSYTRKDVQDNEGKPNILETTTNPTTEYGFIAQELESTLNKFNAKDNGIISKDDAGMLGVRYNDLLAPMVKAMQEQQAIIEELKARILILEK